MFNSEGRGEVELIHSSYLTQLCFAQHGGVRYAYFRSCLTRNNICVFLNSFVVAVVVVISLADSVYCREFGKPYIVFFSAGSILRDIRSTLH